MRMRFLKILKFNRDDFKHLFWLTKTCIKRFLKGDNAGAIESIYFIKIHLTYDSKKIR